MTDRLSPLDASFLYLETPTTAMHVGGIAIVDADSGRLRYDALLALVEQRIGLVPRYRQKLAWVPGRLASPVWIDDADFDAAYHVRRGALPPPGTQDQLLEFVAGVHARPLDRDRPLWEIYLVEGLRGPRSAIVTKIHHAMVDGVAAIDLGAVLLDRTPDARVPPPPPWQPRPGPDAGTVLREAVQDVLRRPEAALEAARAARRDPRAALGRLAGVTRGLLAAAGLAGRPAPRTPLNAPIGASRRLALARGALADYQRVRTKHGGTVNDVILATVAGALRAWLLGRGHPLDEASTVRALVPVDVRARQPADHSAGRTGNQVSSYLVDLPVGEPEPLARLVRISAAMDTHKQDRQFVGVDALVGLSGFLPPPVQAYGARIASSLSSRVFNVVVSNVAGPPRVVYAAGAAMLELFPIVPLARGQALSIGVASYDGGAYYGLNADRAALSDVDVVAGLLEQSLAELVGTVG